jgi:DNA-binding NtrC family response regulator
MTGTRILVIEDEYLIALEIQSVLADGGFVEVEHAATEEEALLHIEQGGFTAAVADANLYGRGISRIAAALTARAVPFVIVTGYGRESLPAEVAHAPLVEKPFDSRLLLQAVTRLLAPAGR